MNVRSLVTSTLALAVLSACAGEPEEAELQAPPAADPPPAEREPATPVGETPPPAAAAERGGMVDAASLGARVYTVQVGAFAREANATRLEARLQDGGFPVWRSTTDLDGRTLERVRVGATTTPAASRGLAALLEERLGLPYWVAPVSPETRLPADILEETQRATGG